MKKKKETFAELYEPSWKILEIKEEDRDKDILVKVAAVIQEADIINGNDRVYPSNILTREVKKLQTKVEKRKLFSSLDHTISSSGALRTTAAVITKLWMEGVKVFGEFDVLNTSNGKDLAVLLRSSEVGISSRGIGSSKEQIWKGKKTTVMQDDYKLVGFDFVTEGSVKNAVPYKVEHEEEENMEIKTMEDFEKALPEEYKKLQERIADELSKKFETKLAEKVAEVKKTTEEEVKKSMAEENEKINKELETKNTVVDKIIEVLKEEGILEISSDEKNADKDKENLKKQVDSLQSSLKEKDEKVSTLQNEVDKLKVVKYGEKKLEGEKFKDILSEKIKDAKTEKEIDEIIGREKKSIEEVLKVKGLKESKEEPKGKGKITIEELDANKKEQQKLAGIQE